MLVMPHIVLPFQPLLGITSGFMQTALGSFGLPLADPLSSPLMVPVSDGDQLYCLESTPEQWSPEEPTIVLAHGLGGSSSSRYMVRLSRYLFTNGHRVVRINFRSAGPGLGFARQPNHGGRSEDLLAACILLNKQYPQSKLKVVGFSLAGNILLKMLGELTANGNDLIEKAIAICPAVDLKTGVKFIGRPENRFLEKYYVDSLLEIIDRKKRIYPHYPNIQFPNPLSLYGFDEYYTAPLCGFNSAEEYYDLSSSNRVIHKITVPTTILYALDDPVIPSETLSALDLPDNITAFSTQYGGHVGYLSWSGSDFWLRWMDRKVIEWLF